MQARERVLRELSRNIFHRYIKGRGDKDWQLNGTIYNLQVIIKFQGLSILVIQDINSCCVKSIRHILPEFHFCINIFCIFITEMTDSSMLY